MVVSTMYNVINVVNSDSLMNHSFVCIEKNSLM